MEIFQLLVRMMAALAVVLILAYISLKLGLPRLYQGGTPAAGMEVVDRLALSPRAWLFIVKVGEDYLLLGVNGGSITYLKELSPVVGDSLEYKSHGSRDFKEWLRTKMAKEGDRS